MRPALCLFTDSLEPSGVGEHMLALAADLQGQYRIAFVCPPSTGGDPLLARARALGLATFPLNIKPEVKTGAAPWKSFIAWLRAQRFDLLHGHAGIGWEGHGGVYAARLADVPVVVRTEHLPDLITDRWQRAAYRRLVPLVDRLICVSEAARSSFVERGVPPEKLRVVRNGIVLRPLPSDRAGTRAVLEPAPRARIVLTIGRMTEQKGHRYLLDAVPAVLARHPDVYFLWAGVGPLQSQLRAWVRTLGLEGRVWFLGRRHDVADLLAAADLFVLPSLFEGLPLVVLEAMAAGLPVVGTRVCGTAEAVHDGVTGRLVPAKDAPALATAIVEVLDDPELARRRGAAGRERVEREFSATRMARETGAIYAELLDRVQPVAVH